MSNGLITRRFLFVAILGGWLCPHLSPLQAAEIIHLTRGTPDQGFTSYSFGVSADGTYAAGWVAQGGGGREAFRWSRSSGLILRLGDLPGNPFESWGTAISADGSTVVGGGHDYSKLEAFRWRFGEAMAGLGYLELGGTRESEARGVSGDGGVVVGLSRVSGGYEAFRWESSTGIVGLGDFEGGSFNSLANAVSANANVIVGSGTSASGTEAFRWTSVTGMQGLGKLPLAYMSQAKGVSADGTLIVGFSEGRAPYHDAVMWSQANGILALGDLPGGNQDSTALAVSDNGEVVGNSSSGRGDHEAFIWTASSGMKLLSDVLRDAGADLSQWQYLRDATAISADGRWITGHGMDVFGNYSAFVARLDPPPPPVAPSLAFVRSPGLTLKIRITDILAQCSDPGGNPLTLQSLGSSSQGAAVVLGPSHVLYTPVNDRTDTFAYTIANSLGITATGQITVTVTNPGGLVQSIDTSGGVVTIQFAGIPGYAYDVQRTVDFSAWNTLDTITAPGLGLFSFTDPNPPQPFAAYRLMQDWSPLANYWGDGTDGALNTAGSTSFPVTTDGDVVVKQFTSLTINEGHTVTTQNRCRGLVIYVDGDAVINGTLSMTARGANVNPTLPDSIAATGIRLIRFKTGGSASLAASDLGGAGVGGVGSLWRSVEAHQAGATGNGVVYTVAREGGAGAPPCNGPNGYNGATAAGGTGGGGSGTSNDGWGGGGSAGSCYSGGSGGGSAHCQGVGEAGHPFGGPGGAANGGWCGQDDAPGGGAGNPGGYSHWAGWPAESGTGGLLVLMVRGNLSIGAQGKITSDGSRGGEYVFAGGSSGGGRIIVLHAGTMNNGGVIRATGGQGRLSAQGYQGGHGGDGAVTVDQIDP